MHNNQTSSCKWDTKRFEEKLWYWYAAWFTTLFFFFFAVSIEKSQGLSGSQIHDEKGSISNRPPALGKDGRANAKI